MSGENCPPSSSQGNTCSNWGLVPKSWKSRQLELLGFSAFILRRQVTSCHLVLRVYWWQKGQLGVGLWNCSVYVQKRHFPRQGHFLSQAGDCRPPYFYKKSAVSLNYEHQVPSMHCQTPPQEESHMTSSSGTACLRSPRNSTQSHHRSPRYRRSVLSVSGHKALKTRAGQSQNSPTLFTCLGFGVEGRSGTRQWFSGRGAEMEPQMYPQEATQFCHSTACCRSGGAENCGISSNWTSKPTAMQQKTKCEQVNKRGHHRQTHTLHAGVESMDSRGKQSWTWVLPLPLNI